MPEMQAATLPNAIEAGPAVQPPAARPGSRIYAALDSWRGVCACMVALAHVHTVGLAANWPFIKHSYLFVDFFFVLSGFIIFENYFDRLKQGFSLTRFMFLRFGRGEFQREVQRFQAKRSLTSLPRSLKRAWIGVM